MRDWLEAISRLKILVIGDLIIDEYVYVTPMGKSPKENIIVTHKDEIEVFNGGVLAAAAHLFSFSQNVDIWWSANAVRKTRFVEKAYTRKIFEYHSTEERTPDKPLPDFKRYDLIVVCDYGHGCITHELIEKLWLDAPFLSVMCQANSANYGFNLVTKYPHCNFIAVDEHEARLATQNRDGPLEESLPKLGRSVVATRGHRGCLGWDGKHFYDAPAVAHIVTDTMGAGDAFFVITSAFAAVGTPMRDLVVIGNAAGALKVESVGHRRPVTKDALLERLRQEGSPLGL